MTARPALSRDEAAELARFWRENGFYINWTTSNTGDGAKRCTSKWKETSKAIDGDPGSEAGKIGDRLKRKNPVVVAAASGLVLVDCDSAEDVAVFKALKPPKTYTVTSSPGKLHAYYRAPAGIDFHKVEFAGGAVTLSSDGYLVAAPARHPDGHLYEATDVPIADMPDDLRDAIRALAGAERERAEHEVTTDPAAKIPVGRRHAELRGLSMRMALSGSSYEAIVAALRDLDENRCEKPKRDEAELRRLAKTALERAAMDPVTRMVAEGDDEERPKKKRCGFVESLDDGSIPELTRWLPGYEELVPVGELVNLIGLGGTGKGYFAVALAARLGSDAPMLYSGTEDNAGRLKKRLDAAGSRAGLLRLWADERRTRLAFPRDVDIVRNAIVDHGARVMVIDSGPGHLEKGLDNHRVEDVRKMVDPLAGVCEETGCTIILVLHPPKSGETLTGLGSGAWSHAARHELFIVRDDEEDDVRHVIVTKTNVGDKTGVGRVCRFETRHVAVFDRELEMEATEAVGFLDVTIEESTKSVFDLLKKEVGGARHHKGTKGNEARETLLALLTVEGEDSASIKHKVAADVGCSPNTVWGEFKKLQAEGLAEYRFETTGAFGAGAQRHVWRLSIPQGFDEAPLEKDAECVGEGASDD